MTESKSEQLGECIDQIVHELNEMPKPASVVRLQPHGVMDFQGMIALIPYYKDMGIDALYLPPITQARSKSTHGYDVVDATSLDSRFGDETDLANLSRALKDHGMQLIVDVVANHMAIDSANQCWVATLEGSDSSAFFDIDLRDTDKVILPLLSQDPVKAVVGGSLGLLWDQQRLWFSCCDIKVPLALSSYATLQRYLEQQGRMLNETVNLNRIPHHIILQLLEEQPYLLMPWHSGSAQINYRRFFDILDLIGVRQELEQPFRSYHASLCRWVSCGWIEGLRIDHPDGLRLPRQYLCRLQQQIIEALVSDRLAEHSSEGIQRAVAEKLSDCNTAIFPVVVEKILTGNESLPGDWPVCGTVGYEFLNRLTAIFIDQSQEQLFSKIYQEWSCDAQAPQAALMQCKINFIGSHYVAEMRRLTNICKRALAQPLCGKQIYQVLVEATARMDIYRTYFEPDRPATQRDSDLLKRIFPEVGDTHQDLQEACQVLLQLFEDREYGAEALLLWQQLSPAVMAKGFEDTFLYVYNRFIALNEVGGDPFTFGCSTDELHRHNQERLAHHPYGFISSQTHDAKRSEDVRMRLAALSEMPQQWQHFCEVARKTSKRCKVLVRTSEVPEPNMEYFILQTLAGFWPSCALQGDADRLARVQEYVVKAAREAKRQTNWISPDQHYERACCDYLAQLLDVTHDALLLSELCSLTRLTECIGRLKSLASWIVKMASPGIVDLYQGCELWFECLVDPDNRRPIDYGERRTLLAEAKQHLSYQPEWLENDGRGIGKMWLIRTGLQHRSRYADLYLKGSYTPLSLSGPLSEHVVAFERNYKGMSAICIVARTLSAVMPDLLHYQPKLWAGTSLALPQSMSYVDLVSGSRFSGSRLPLESVLASTPFAWLVSAEDHGLNSF